MEVSPFRHTPCMAMVFGKVAHGRQRDALLWLNRIRYKYAGLGIERGWDERDQMACMCCRCHIYCPWWTWTYMVERWKLHDWQ